MKKFFRKSTILAGWILFGGVTAIAAFGTIMTMLEHVAGNGPMLACWWAAAMITGILALSVRPFLDWFTRWDP